MMDASSVDGGSRCAYGRAGTGLLVLARTCAGRNHLLMRLPDIRGWLLTGSLALCAGFTAALTTAGYTAKAGSFLEERKMPMKFSWIACQPNCRGWVTAVGIVTSDSPSEFEAFARG